MIKAIKYLIFFMVVVLFVSCANEAKENDNSSDEKNEITKEQHIEQISKAEAELFKLQSVDVVAGEVAIKAYADYVLKFPNDSIAPNYLLKAAEVATAINQFNKAAAFYTDIENNYSDFKKMDVTLLMHAFLYDNSINNDEQAKILYQRLIEKYPNSIYANDAKAAIANLGKSDEELIKEFEKKNNIK